MWKYIFFSFIFLAKITLVTAQPVELDKIKVIVNEGIILQSEVNKRLKILKNSIKKDKDTKFHFQKKTSIEQILEELIIETIQQQEAKHIGISISNDYLNDVITNIIKNNRFNINNLTEKDLKEQIQKNLMIKEVRNILIPRRIKILPIELKNLIASLLNEREELAQYKIIHIQLCFNKQLNKEQIQNKAKMLLNQLKKSTQPKSTFYGCSKEPQVIKNNRGWIGIKEMPTIFANQIKQAKINKGTIIGPFQSSIGLHILKIEDIKDPNQVIVTEVNARHILIKPTLISDDDEIKRKLNGFIYKIKTGKANFEKLAREHSQDLNSSANNGELGYQSTESYLPEFQDKIKLLPIGQISKPFKTTHGWHILEILDRRKTDHTELSIKNKAHQILFEHNFNLETQEWLREIYANSFIEIIQDKYEH
ncbi:chaperone surA [Candidatus Photodesmus katoptron]|uniref:peptidylprolyl isomerase n=1 Tax=Candidatus Photodesmus anomalopis TaxID=28176 RepID=UPI0004DAE431|nr:peptidylprolyl isomerase [Candidatus Photodesmus katoptron]KEY90070.1 chaperone surA [Candidatus Photodesmus katoptron]